MEEKKKRWRPSLTAYRALENEVSELKEGMTAIKSENVSLKRSNDMLEKEIYRLRENVSKYEKESEELKDKLCLLKGRGLLARLLNRDY